MLTDHERQVFAEIETALKADTAWRVSRATRAVLRPVCACVLITAAAILAAGVAVATMSLAVVL